MPGFPVRGTQQRPRAVPASRDQMKFINANELRRKSGEWRD
jgi:hypothetical protein